MPKTIAEIYDTLTETSQQEVFDFMLYLVQKEKKYSGVTKTKRKNERLSALSDLAGSMKEIWKNTDALEYQNSHRQERNFD
ncbi:MAG: DUF2281 domain-containing protein [Treponema sp.]|nr:DUF2281 domain-containing protein [Treponema sp.]